MPIQLKNLPFSIDALEPYISSETVSFHYGKHQKGYVEKANLLISQNPAYADLSLEEVIRQSRRNEDESIFNNAAQVWNHEFYWSCLLPVTKQNTTSNTSDLLLNSLFKDSFPSVDDFKEEFFDKCTKLFGSGWVWLVKNTETHLLSLIPTKNAETPAATALLPLLTCDLWEHAYYIDYRNDRKKYLDNFWKLINWEAVQSRNLKK
ncbi:MAG: superoxide dismutase [Bacteriovoracaceae bacterium]|nr:superoxide dismutase [Bacteriovoracaceae bacterium]